MKLSTSNRKHRAWSFVRLWSVVVLLSSTLGAGEAALVAADPLTSASGGASESIGRMPVIAATPSDAGQNCSLPTVDTEGRLTPTGTRELLGDVVHNRIAINFVWTLFAGVLVMFMHAGVALVETGMCRAKNAAQIMAMNLMIYPIGMLGFWICGFAIMFGGVEHIVRHIGVRWFRSIFE